MMFLSLLNAVVLPNFVGYPVLIVAEELERGNEREKRFYEDCSQAFCACADNDSTDSSGQSFFCHSV